MGRWQMRREGVDWIVMKMLYLMSAAMILAVSSAQAEKDVWYDASGKVVRVTPAEKERVAFVPDWKKRENERLEAQRTRHYRNRVHRTRSGWYSGYLGYGGYHYGSYPSYYSGHHGYHHRHHGHHHHSRWGFRGTYHGSGWSVRVGY